MRLGSVFVVVVLLFAGIAACAAVPSVINYQGKLMQPSGAPVPDGAYSMVFSIYDAPTGGNLLWSEPNSSVQVKGGLFNVLLGNTTAFPDGLFDSAQRYFAVKVGTDPEMTPRQLIASSVASQISKTVVDGSITTPKLADQAVTTEKIANAAITAEKLVPGAAVPSGIIAMWSGDSASIPAGWAICDGTNGTPDLRDRFIVGSGTTYTTGATGGAAAISLAHSHTANDHVHSANHSHGMDAAGDHSHHMDFWSQAAPQRKDYYHYSPDGYTEVLDEHTHQIVGDTWGAGSHTHNIQAANFNTGGASDRGMSSALSASTDIRPPYYALAFIMKLP